MLLKCSVTMRIPGKQEGVGRMVLSGASKERASLPSVEPAAHGDAQACRVVQAAFALPSGTSASSLHLCTMSPVPSLATLPRAFA